MLGDTLIAATWGDTASENGQYQDDVYALLRDFDLIVVLKQFMRSTEKMVSQNLQVIEIFVKIYLTQIEPSEE